MSRSQLRKYENKGNTQMEDNHIKIKTLKYRTKRQIIAFVRDIFGSAIVVLSITPYGRSLSNYLFGAVVLGWTIFAMIADTDTFVQVFMGKKPNYLILYGWLLFCFLAFLFGHSEQLGLRYLFVTLIFLWFWYYEEKAGGVRWFICLAFLYSLMISVNSVIQLSTVNPSLARLLASEKGAQYASLFMAGYDYTYAMALFAPLMLYLIRNYQLRRSEKFLCGIFYAVNLVFIIKAQYMIAICLFLAMTLAGLFMKSGKNQVRMFVIIVIFLCTVLAMFCIGSPEEILAILIQKTSGNSALSTINSKLYQILLSWEGHSWVGSMGDRMVLYETSLHTFSENIMLGLGYKNNWMPEIGDHSFIFDTLGRFGILGFSYLCVTLLGQTFMILKKLRYDMYFICMTGLYLFLLCINTGFGAELIFPLYFIAPFLIDFLRRRSDSKAGPMDI